MCQVLEDMRNETAESVARETAARLIEGGRISLEEIARCLPSLSMDELREIAAEIK